MPHDRDTIRLYMQRIARYPLITPEEESRLADEIRRGSQEARFRLVRSNLRLVVKIAHDFKGRGLPLLDLISEGNVGLMRAVDKFDPAKGAKLSSYAAWWIKQSMRRALASQVHTIRVPVQSAARFRKVQKVRAMLREELRREPDIAEVAEAANLSERTVTGVSRVETFVFSIHDPIPQSAEREFSEIIPDIAAVTPDAGVADEETMQRMLELVERLPHPQRMILTLRFGLLGERPHTLEEVSNAFGRSRERVRQIQKQALSRLRAMLDEKPVPGPIAVN